MTINRIHKSEQFVQIPNALLRDERLSFKAKGVLAYMLTHVDGWRADAASIADASRDGRTAVLSAFKELEEFGYRKVVKRQSEDGKWTTEIHWFESPVDGETDDRFTEVGFPDSGSPDAIRTPLQNTIKNTPPSSSSSLRSSSSSVGQDDDIENDTDWLYDADENEPPSAGDDDKPTQEKYQHFAAVVEGTDLSGMSEQEAVQKYSEWWERNTGYPIADWQQAIVRRQVLICNRKAVSA